ncbi:MAG: metal ABC transporter ATP-binding protein [Bacillota bacterium]
MTPNNNNTLISSKDLQVKYGTFTAIRNISFDINKGDFLAVVGPNGGGKSTLIKTLMGIIRPTKGVVEKASKVKIGYVPQNVQVRERHFPASVEEVVATGLLMEKTFPKRITKRDLERIEDILDFLGVGGICKKPIGELSGGQQQRVMLARAMVSNPDMLVLDEPTSALDITMRRKFLEMLNHLNKSHDVTIVLITHDLAIAADYVKHVIHVDNMLLYQGTPTKYDPANLSVPMSEMNPSKEEGGYARGMA